MVLNKFLEVFYKQIEKLNRVTDLKNFGMTNVVIGGSCALQLHGLHVPREPVDLDIILFNASPQQLSVIDLVFTPSTDYKTLGEGEEVRSYEFRKDGLKLNVILAKETVPENLMIWAFKDMRYLKVNTISNIIAAKCTYAEGKNKTFLRGKDMMDLLMLKNINFNLPVSNTPNTDAALVKYGCNI